jgi:hypothetical protein
LSIDRENGYAVVTTIRSIQKGPCRINLNFR